MGKLPLLIAVMALALVQAVNMALAAPTSAKFTRQCDALCLLASRVVWHRLREAVILAASRALVVISATVAFAALAACGTAAQVTPSQVTPPRALYRALLASTIPVSQLPVGFHSSTTRPHAIGANPKRHHAVGEVAIDLDDGTIASIVYVVYPTRAYALRNFVTALKLLKTQGGPKVKLVAPGLPRPSAVLSGSGYTTVTFVVRNVGVNAVTIGATPAALRIAQLGRKHLNTVR